MMKFLKDSQRIDLNSILKRHQGWYNLLHYKKLRFNKKVTTTTAISKVINQRIAHSQTRQARVTSKQTKKQKVISQIYNFQQKVKIINKWVKILFKERFASKKIQKTTNSVFSTIQSCLNKNLSLQMSLQRSPKNKNNL